MEKCEVKKYVERVRNGDKSAFDNLYSEYYQRVFFFVKKQAKNHENAEDITQRAFLNAFEKIDELENPEEFSSWVHRMAMNIFLDECRKNKRIANFKSDESVEYALENSVLNEPIMIPEDYAINEDRRKQVREIIDELKPDMKSALILYYYDNMTVREISDVMGIGENNVKQKLFQARKKIEKRIKQLQKQGVTLCMAPVGLIIGCIVDADYSSAAAMPLAATATTAATGKVAVMTAAAAIVVGVPLGLGLLGNNHFGDYRVKDSNTDSIDVKPIIINSTTDSFGFNDDYSSMETVIYDSNAEDYVADESGEETSSAEMTDVIVNETNTNTDENVPAADNNTAYNDDAVSNETVESQATQNNSSSESSEDANAFVYNFDIITGDPEAIGTEPDDNKLKIYELSDSCPSDLYLPSSITSENLFSNYDYANNQSNYSEDTFENAIKEYSEKYSSWQITDFDLTLMDDKLDVLERINSISVDDDNEYFTVENGVLYNKDKTEIKYSPCGNKIDSLDFSDVSYIGTYAFYKSTVSAVSANSTENDFYLSYNSFEGSSVKNIEISCEGSITLSNESFKNCISLERVSMKFNNPDQDNGYFSIYKSCFANCTALKEVAVDYAYISTRAFENCSSLKTVTFGEGTYWIDEEAFKGCTNLKNVYFNDEDSECDIAESAFIDENTGKPYSDKLIFHVYKDTAPYEYAVDNGIKYVLLD